MLIKALIGHQREMILRFKPILRQQLASHRQKTDALLEKLPPCYRTAMEKNQVFLAMLHKFSFTFIDIVKNSRVSLEQA